MEGPGVGRAVLLGCVYLARGMAVNPVGDAARQKWALTQASALTSGEYELALKGVTNDQSTQDVGYYYFHVRKK